ncbi:ABC transporter ATP-binding protein YojI [compost metagenome]
MLTYFSKKLSGMLALATISSSISALLAVSLFVMISRARTAGLQDFDTLRYALAWLLLLVTSIGASRLLSLLSTKSVYKIRTSLIRRILGTSYEKLEQAGSPRLYNVLTNDVAILSNTFSELPTFVFNVILMVCCLSFLAFLSLKLFAVLAVAIGVSFLVSKTLIRRLGKLGAKLRETQDSSMEAYRGMLDGSAQLTVDELRKSFYYNHDLEQQARTLGNAEVTYRFYSDINRIVTVAQIFLLLGIMMEAGRHLGDHTIVMTFALVITYCASPFANVLNLLQLFANARISLNKIDSLQIDPEIDPQLSVTAPLEWNSIRFSQVEYTYRKDGSETPFVLGPLELEIRKGEVTFITGGNGSGKSTFIKLLLTLHEPSGGTVYIDGVPLDAGNRDGYKALFAIVLSDFYLFKQVLDAHGKPAANADVKSLLERFNLSSVVKLEDGAFDTVRLSQGQKKRLALVAAIAQNKDIYVLDEWAADQDPHYRKAFYEEIIPWLKASGKTIVAITHDDRYFCAADHRIDFEAGSVRNDSASLGFTGGAAIPLLKKTIA